MNVWLTTIGEPVPVQEGAGDRLHRTGFFAHFLARHGHDVTWWTSDFDHFRKKHWFGKDTTLAVNERLTIRLLHGCGYGSNVSLARIRDQRQIAKRFAELARQEPRPPQVVVTALPTIELCNESVRYGQERGMPVILDMRDMWPDLFADVVPKPFRPLAMLPLLPMYFESRRACAGATAIIGVTDPFVDWGLRRGRRTRSPKDRSFGFGYSKPVIAADKLEEARRIWCERGVGTGPGEFVACFFGTIGRQFEFDPVIRAAAALHDAAKPVRFVLCGAGDRVAEYRAATAHLPNVLWPGWVGAAEMRALMDVSSLGLAPYRESPNFSMNIPNKPAEYMAAGLPVALGLKNGILKDLLESRKCGFSYEGKGDRLTRAIGGLASERPRLAEMSANAARLFEEQFTAEVVYGKMMAYLEEMV